MTKKHKKNSKFFSIVCLCISFALCLSMANLFSSVLTVGNISISTTSTIPSYNYYAISLGKSSVSTTLEETQNKIKKQNGAGFLWEIDGVYYLMASAYSSKTDCEKVKSNLISSGYSANIIDLKIESIAINKDYPMNSKNVLNNAISCFHVCFEKLYDISISIDTNIKTETDCKVFLSDLISSVQKNKTNLESTFSSSYTKEILQIKLALDNCIDILSELSEAYSSENQTFSSKVKYAYFNILRLFSSLASSIDYEI